MGYLDDLLATTSGSRQRISLNSDLTRLAGLAGQPKGGGGPAPAVAPQQAPKVGANGHFQGDGHNHSGGKGLNPEFMSRLNRMLKDAPGKVTLNSGYRSPERQGQLFNQAVQKYGSVSAARKWVAPPGRSKHGQGIAYDLGYSSVAAGQWMRANATKYGLHFPMAHEPWHIELKGSRG